MTPRRKIEIQAKVTEIIAQETRHLADCADYNEIARDDEEDDYLRTELRRQADLLVELAAAHMRVDA